MALGTETAADNCSVASVSNDAPSTYLFGATTVTWTVTDGTGNTAGCTQEVTVSDDEVPTMACQNITVELDATGNASISTAGVDNGSSDNCGTVSLSLSGQTSYDCSDVDDVITVTLSGDDGNGNTASCTADVTVTDDNLPDDDCDGVADVCDICPGGDDSYDANGDGIADCSQLLNYNGYSSDWHCANNKIALCHNGNTLCVNKNSLPSHFNHGDNIGPCTSCGGGQNMAVNPNGNNVHAYTDHLELELFPNPANGQVSIQLHGLEGTASVAISDQLGRRVWAQQMEEGQHALQLDLSNNVFENGIYLVSVISQGERVTKRLVVAK